MEFGFLLKKIIGFWILPLSLCVLLLSAGLILLWLNKRTTLGKSLCTAGLLALVMLSWNPTSNLLLRPMEHQNPMFDTSQSVDYVVVLGNAIQANPDMPAVNQLSSSALKRLLEGLRILDHSPNAKLIVSGHGNLSASCAELYARAAIAFGVDRKRIIELRQPKDTREEAIATKAIVMDAKVALVTSASHMSRALNFFNQQDINALPAPTHFLTPNAKDSNWKFDAEGLLKSERAFYEAAGRAWQWLIK